MKKTMLAIGLLALWSFKVLSQPVSPLNYTPSRHSDTEIKSIYKALFKGDKLKGEDCFKRAYLWAYQMEQKFNARPIKVFFHYTNKFNKELDSQGKESSLGRRLSGGSRIVWDFHVAPAVENENGEVMVFDPVVFPKHGRAMTLKTWVQKLSNRGEFFLKRRAKKLIKDRNQSKSNINRYKKMISNASTTGEKTSYRIKLNEATQELKETKKLMKYIGVNSNGSTNPIKCREIEHIEEFDKNQYTEWCHYQKTSMYYFATGELRVLNYGTLGNHAPGKLSTQNEINNVIYYTLRYPINPENLNTKKYFQNGNDMYQQKFYDDGAKYEATEFSDYYLWMSLHEFKKKHRPELEFFKTYVTSRDKDLENKLKADEKEKRREAKREAKAERKRQKEEERRRRRARRNS